MSEGIGLRDVEGEEVSILRDIEVSLIELNVIREVQTVNTVLFVKLKGSHCTGLGGTEGVHTSLTALIEE